MGLINIEDFRIPFRIGVSDKERSQPQILLITIKLNVDFNPCTASDHLMDTIDYMDVCSVIQNWSTERAFKLIETLAHQLAYHLLEVFSKAKDIDIIVKKPSVMEGLTMISVQTHLSKSPTHTT
ncbi:MAG: dihydroneopterin aldolase [Bdellovibrionota bacterium]